MVKLPTEALRCRVERVEAAGNCHVVDGRWKLPGQTQQLGSQDVNRRLGKNEFPGTASNVKGVVQNSWP